MANHYETLLVPTDADNERLHERYQRIRDSEDRWPVYPYYPMDLDYFRRAYQTLVAPDKRAAHDLEHNIVPQGASYKTCIQWTWELARETAGQGSTPGPYFAHIGIANLLNGGQVDFINGYELRQTRDKQLVLITPDDDSEEMKPPWSICLPGCTASIDGQQTLTVCRINEEAEVLEWRYKWNGDTDQWFELPICPLRSDQAKAKHGPIILPDLLESTPKTKLRSRPYNLPFVFEISEEVVLGSLRCPVCSAEVSSLAAECQVCGTHLRQCMRCFRRYQHELKSCPNCGHRP